MLCCVTVDDVSTSCEDKVVFVVFFFNVKVFLVG